MPHRARFRVVAVNPVNSPAGRPVGASLAMRPVYGGEENEKFFRLTPWGELFIGTVVPEVADQFKPGVEVWLDITPIGAD